MLTPTDMTIFRHPYEWVFSEESILKGVESQMCNAACLLTSAAAQQALWHARGVIGHGGTKEQAKYAYDFGLEVAKWYGIQILDVIPFETINWASRERNN